MSKTNPNANEIGVFGKPTAPPEQQRKSPRPRGSISPFRQERQRAQQQEQQKSAFAPRTLKTKLPPILGVEIPIIDLQSCSSLINQKVMENQESAVTETTQQSMTSEVLHFMADPQILVSFETNPGELPRSIALERKRREIASINFIEMFENFMNQSRNEKSKLQLELFDDDLFETKSLKAWFDIAKEVEIYDANKREKRKVRGLYGNCYIQDKWQKCIIIGQKKQQEGEYDDRLLVQIEDEKKLQPKYWVPRLYVFVWGEDPRVYLKRLQESLTNRDQTESLLKYEALVENMPGTNLLELTQKTIEDITKTVTPFNCKSHRIYLKDYAFEQQLQNQVPELVKEVQNVYYKAQNQILFEISLEKQPSLIQELEIQLAKECNEKEYEEKYDNEDKQLFCYEYLHGEPMSNEKILELKENYHVVREKIIFDSFLLQDEAVKCLQIIQKEVQELIQQKISERELERFSDYNLYFKQKLPYDILIPQYCIFLINQRLSSPLHPLSLKPPTLEEFKSDQHSNKEKIKHFLSDEWIKNIKDQLIEVLKNSGKGHYNINVKSKEIYMQSKLQKLLKRIGLMLCDGIRDLVEQSASNYVEMFDQQSKWQVQCVSANKVISQHPNNPKEGSTVYRQPIFSISLNAVPTPMTADDRTNMERMNANYITGISPLTEETIDLEEHDENQGEDKVNEENKTDEVIEDVPQQAEQPQEQTITKKKKDDKKEETVLKVQYLTNPKDFISCILEVFDQGIKCVNEIPSIEYQVLQTLESHEKIMIATPQEKEEQFVKQRDAIVTYLESSIAPLDDFLKCFSSYKELLLIDEEKWSSTIKFRAELYLRQQQDQLKQQQGEEIKAEYLKAVSPQMRSLIESISPLSPSDLKVLVHQKMDQKNDLMKEIPEVVHCGSFLIRTHQLRSLLIGKCDALAQSVGRIINQIAEAKSQIISRIFFAIQRKLSHKAKSIEDSYKVESFINKGKLDIFVGIIKQNLVTMNEYHQILEELCIVQNNAQVSIRWKTCAYPKDIKGQVEKTMKIIAEDKERFKQTQIDEQTLQAKQIETLSRQVVSFQQSSKYTKLEDYVDANAECDLVYQNLEKLIRLGKQFNSREQLMQQMNESVNVTDYSNLVQLKKDFEPIRMVWKSLFDFRKAKSDLYTQDFKFVDAGKVEQTIDECQRNVAKAGRNIPEDALKLKEVTELIRKEINEFRQTLPLVSLLRNPGLRKRHWMRMTKETKVDLKRLRYINGIELKQYGSKADQDQDKSADNYQDMAPDVIDQLNLKPVGFTFKQAVEEYHLDNFQDKIRTISETASKEFAIESVLCQLERNWKYDKQKTDAQKCSAQKFNLAQYQGQDCYILRSLDEIIQKLDDNINLIQSMSASSFKVFFLDEINMWDTQLTQTSDIIDVWVQVQQAWLYLEPIFASPDIVKQLPTESKNFKQVDSFWRKFMNSVFKNPVVLDVCTETDKLQIKLQENLKILDTVQKGLADYLETKRIAFPRFFFLSDEELLSILSNTKDPTSVQPFLRSCFENMARIKFNVENNYEMVSMTSHEGEIVEFAEPLIPQGQVETWMGQLEKLAIKTIKLRCSETLAKYIDQVTKNGIQGRANWVRCGFAQGVVLINQLMFCNDTEYAIQGGYLDKFREYLDRQLTCMTELVRQGLNKLENKAFSALLTYDVFQRDTVQSLIDNKIQKITDFDWAKHPRHYSNVDSVYLQPIHGNRKEDVYYNMQYPIEKYAEMAKTCLAEALEKKTALLVCYCQILATLPYQFEYLGNTPRLVITPLTLKIYSTISQSQGMFKFSACSGPAGSGKTETSKQMTNKEFALVCVVFNCSEGLDLIGIKRMLSGCISSGGGLVMDEINRLSLDVLSVFAQMVLGVQRGLQLCGGSIIKPAEVEYGKTMAHIQTTKILFENTELNLQSTCTVIITQNPNYTGRQKLPANLVALFRAVSVMVPNYMKICQIRLYSFGFKKAEPLAQKAVSVFKLCSEQLSLQSWYDYGMRAINSTIQAAGNIRQDLGNMCCQEAHEIPKLKDGSIDQRYYTEDQIVLRAITEVNLPKFLQNDSLLFSNILKDLFPGVKQPFIDYHLLVNEVNDVLRSNIMGFLQPDESYVNKIVDLYMTINLRHGLMTLGLANAGKGMSIYALTEAMNRLNKREVDARIVKFNQYMKKNPNTLIKDVNVLTDDYASMRYNIQRIDPKSITMDQLFGQFDPISKEWQDGVLSTVVRNAVADYNKHTQNIEQNMYKQTGNTISDVNPDIFVQKNNYTRQLVLCDGYMDSLWIESLNTVLDDSKRLCLTSGEIICLSPVMNLVFNMDSVAEASPATISRNGMLYYTSLDIIGVGSKSNTDPGQIVITGTLSLQAYIQTWIDRLKDQVRLAKPDTSKMGDISIKKAFETKNNKNEEYSAIALRFKELSEKVIAETIAVMKLYCKQLQELMDANIVLSIYKLIDTFINELEPNDFGLLEPWQLKQFEKYIDYVFLFSTIWAIGGSVKDEASRAAFDKWIRSKWPKVSKIVIPDDIDGIPVLVFDLCLEYAKYSDIKEAVSKVDNFEEALVQFPMKWSIWGKEELNNLNMNEQFFGAELKDKVTPAMMTNMSLDVIIPSRANIQQTALIRRLLVNGYYTLIVGQTGSGKTSVIKNYLLKNKEDGQKFSPIIMNFSANTQAQEVMNFLDSKLEKKKRGVYAPPSSLGKKYIFYVDDLNLPMKEKYGCINSHEFLRQMIAHGGWYDLKELTFKSVIDTYVVSSMVQAGGSRNPVTQRLLRHFFVMDFLEMNDKELERIFGLIMNWWSKKQFDPTIVAPLVVSSETANEINRICNIMVPTAIQIYSTTRNTFLPTPAKIHYTYNLRDLSKLFQGILMIDPSSIGFNMPKVKGEQPTPATKEEAADRMISLFIHENLRVFSDRLVDHVDQKQFTDMMVDISKQHFGSIIEKFQPSSLMFGDFGGKAGAGYQEMSNKKIVNTKILEALQYYNDQHTKDPMNLVLFDMAIQHLCRIARILRQPNSNLLIIGVGGVGRLSLTKLASSLLQYDMFSIQLKKGYGIADWRNDIKSCLMACGLAQKQQVFLIQDQHIFNDRQLEDVSIMLNSCDLQSLYDVADMERIMTEMKPYCGGNQSKLILYDTYLQKVKQNLHIVICFSPSGTSLRTRLRKFPALVNCCSIDYILSWPEEALINVAEQVYQFTKSDVQMIKQQQLEFLKQFIDDQARETNKSIKEIQDSIIRFCVNATKSVETMSVAYKKEQGRFNYVTPTLFLNLLQIFIQTLNNNYNKVNTYKMQLSNGLEQLQLAEVQVGKLQEELKLLQPQLMEKSKQVEEFMKQLKIDEEDANVTREQVSQEKQNTSKKVEECTAIEQSATEKLKDGNIKLEDALRALDALERADFLEVATYKNPSAAVVNVIEATSIMLQLKGKKVTVDGKQKEDFSDEIKKQLSNPNMVLNLKQFDKEHIPDGVVARLKQYIENDQFKPEIIVTKSKACAGLCMWVHAMYTYHFINLQVIPLRIAQKQANEELQVAQAKLDDATQKLQQTEDRIAKLRFESQQTEQEKQRILNEVSNTQKKLERASTLISSLKGEKSRWIQSLSEMDIQIKCLLGDSLFASAYVIYAGAFTSDFRQRLSTQWIQIIHELNIKTSKDDLRVTDILSDQVTIMNYVNQYKLPSDQHSKENAAMMFTTLKFCLLIDPEKQAQNFLKNFYKEQGCEVCKANDKDLLRTLENCVRFGKVLIIINVTEDIDPSLNSILEKQLVKEANQLCVKLGDNYVPYNDSFKLFLCSHLANPNYSPEQFVKLTVLNFAITPLGLQDQLLGQLVALERPDQESLKNSLMISNAKMKMELKALESKVLEQLATNTGDILENLTLIDTLAQSQKTSADIQVKVQESEITEAEIDKTRIQYVAMAQRGSILYFCIQDLQKIDYMYQYSLNWYMQLYVQSIQETEQNSDIQQRLHLLITHFSLFLYQTICRSLFESHKLLFALLMTIRIQLNTQEVNLPELKYFIVGSSLKSQKPNPQPSWLSEKAWGYICELETQISVFEGISATFENEESCQLWQKVFESTAPEDEHFPEPFGKKLTPFQKLFPVTALRPDRVIAASRIYVSTVLGQEYMQSQVFNLEKSFKDSTNLKPILFLLNDMADPMSDLMTFADSMKMGKKTQALSLGRGIEKTALNLIASFAERGNWCVLQNCHLCVAFLKTLEGTLEEMLANAGAVHRDFRLFLTSQPTTDFPVSILQNSVKISVENPNNLKANLLRVWENNISDKILQEGCTNVRNIERYKKLVFSLSIFYSVLLQRKKYGSIGFNTPYPWSTSDIAICIQQLPIFLDRFLDIFPKEALLYLFAEINIGGCVTDAQDQKTVNAIVADYINPNIFQENWVFQFQNVKSAETPKYMLHQLTNMMSYSDYLDFIRSKISIECHPENLGMNLNSNITADRNESQNLLDDLMRVQSGKLVTTDPQQSSKQAAGPAQNNDIQIINTLKAKVPKAFDIDAVMLKYPTKFEESLNSLLVQECGRYNVLLQMMATSLVELIKALEGKTIMSSELEEVLIAVTMNRQPELFQRYSYPSLKPLSSYMNDLNTRIKFLNNWVENGKPRIYNISLFYFAQGFLTSVLQNYARKHVVAIDTINFDFSVSDIVIDDQQFVQGGNKSDRENDLPTAEDATYITGLYLEAAMYDTASKTIIEARPRELYAKMPILLFTPIVGQKIVRKDQYECPCYRTLARFGMLSTTGHSTNFMLFVLLPCKPGEGRHWIKRSVAMFASLSD